MKTRQTIYAAMSALLVLAPLARGESPANDATTHGNAALQYWQAFDTMPGTEADQKILDDWKHVALDQATAKLIERGRLSLSFLHRGAQMSECDWGLDLGDGPYLVFPHLRKARSLARLACLRVRYELEHKQWEGAVDDACDAMALGRGLAREPILFGMMYQHLVEEHAIDALSPALNKLDPRSLQRLMDRMDRLPADQPEAGWLRVQNILIDWMINEVRKGGPTPNWSYILGPILVGEGKAPEAGAIEGLVKTAGGTPDAVIGHMQELKPYFDDAAKLVETPLSQNQFDIRAAQLRKRFDGNPLAKYLLPALPAAHDTIVGPQMRMVLLKYAIAVVKRGPDAVKGMEDPINHEPVKFEKRADGFELASSVMRRGQPVTIVVGESIQSRVPEDKR